MAHAFLRAYPGYTVKKYEDEVTWRQVDGMLGVWRKHPPLAVLVDRIATILMKKNGYRIEQTTPVRGQDVVERLARWGIG